MARPKHATFDKQKVVAENRKVRHNYFIEETFDQLSDVDAVAEL